MVTDSKGIVTHLNRPYAQFLGLDADESKSIIGNSQATAKLKQEALVAAANTYPVLIVGESGTGKELFAQSIHHASSRGHSPDAALQENEKARGAAKRIEMKVSKKM